MPQSPLPDRSPLDRIAVERVLARAAELQAGDSGELPAERMTEAQLVELGKEVGLSPAHIRQALAEERTRVPTEAAEPDGLLAQVVGPATVTTSRTVRIAAPTAIAQLDAWMQREECLVVMRRFEERILWEPRRDLVTQVRRGLDFGGRGYLLSRAQMVAATVVGMEGGQSVVRLDADFGAHRRRVASTGAMLTTLGAGASGAAAAIGVMLPVAILPALAVGAGAVYQARRRQRALVARAALVLEQVLDRLERGELARPSLLAAIASHL